jgi:DNA-binding GntR family transcriptional regulator
MSIKLQSPQNKTELARRFVRSAMRTAGLGGSLPSIAELVEAMNAQLARHPQGDIHSISALPIRQALDGLARDGLLDMGRGRPARVLSTVDLETRGLAESTRDLNVELSRVDLRIEVVPVRQDAVSELAGKMLGLGGDDTLLKVDRLRELVGQARPGSLRWDRAFLPASLGVQMKVGNFGKTDSLYQLENEAGLRPKSREITVAARETTASETPRFLCSSPLPVLAIEQVTVGCVTDQPQKMLRYEFLYALCGAAWKLTYRRQ